METKTPLSQRSATEYHCHTHGWWDAARESGCPTCVVELRRELSAARRDAERFPRFYVERFEWAMNKMGFDKADPHVMGELWCSIYQEAKAYLAALDSARNPAKGGQ